METRLPSKFVQAAFAAAILSLLSGAAGAQAPSWSLTGNAGTDPLTNFLGTKDGKPLVIQPGSGNVGIGAFINPAIPYAKFTVTGANATSNVETSEIMRLMRQGVPGIKNQNSAGFFVGSFEPGIIGRSQLDIKVAGLPNNTNTFGSVPDVTAMSLLGNGNVGIGTSSPGSVLDVHGKTTTQVLEITGGSDLAEPFAMDREAAIQPGMVVAIDPVHPGQLRLPDRAYDRTVAGIVAGANGIDPGLILTSDRAAGEHARPVALTGHVYVFADASHDPIQPGDLLSTADTTGHAMKVTDYARAQSAVLGKAMSALPSGTRLVLVLVSLQ